MTIVTILNVVLIGTVIVGIVGLLGRAIHIQRDSEPTLAAPRAVRPQPRAQSTRAPKRIARSEGYDAAL